MMFKDLEGSYCKAIIAYLHLDVISKVDFSIKLAKVVQNSMPVV